jgi:PhnB protein
MFSYQEENMQTRLNPYLGFDGNARQAMEFYRSVFGGELSTSTYADYQMAQNPDDANKIMHSQLETPNGMFLMASDNPSGTPHENGSNISITLSGDNYEELKSYYQKLLEGGTVLQPLEAAPWGDSFGMLLDRFGTRWLVNISGAKAQ